MVFATKLDLSMTLRSLRRARGLSQGEAAHRSSLARATLAAWESGDRRPRGAPLARLLDALETDDRTRARILHLADPGQARIALADSAFGPPVDVGLVLRAMRERRGMAQAELARRLSVTQATVSRWETGGDAPSAETIHALGFALGASVEETLALASAAGERTGLPATPEAVLVRIWEERVSHPLHEIASLGIEAELWRRATGDPRWDPCLVSVLSARTCRLISEERYEEVAPLAARAVRMAGTTEGRLQAVPALGSLATAERHLGRGHGASERAGDWASGLPVSSAKAWMLRERGMGLVRRGGVAPGMEWIVRSSDVELEANPNHPEPWSHRAEMLAEGYLEAGDARRAAAVVGGRRERRFPSYLFVQIEHALGRAATDAEMAYLRLYTETHDGSPLARRRLATIERRQSRLTGEAPPDTPAPTDPGAQDRLWTAVLRDHRG